MHKPLGNHTQRRKRRWPDRLVGDTAQLRARFREEHDDFPISTARGSHYRKWLNAQRRKAQMRDRRKLMSDVRHRRRDEVR